MASLRLCVYGIMAFSQRLRWEFGVCFNSKVSNLVGVMTQIDKYNKLSLTKRMPNNFSKAVFRDIKATFWNNGYSSPKFFFLTKILMGRVTTVHLPFFFFFFLLNKKKGGSPVWVHRPHAT